MKTASTLCLSVFLLLGLTLTFASPSSAEILCLPSYNYCGCKGDDCSTLKKFSSAGGCKGLLCDGGAPEYCKCQLAKLPPGNSLVFSSARQKNDLKPNPLLDKRGTLPRPVRDCSATAKCGGTTVSCSVKGSGLCQGENGSGVSCTQFLASGEQKTTTSLCE